MPFGAFINDLPPAFFLVVHLIFFLVGAFFAYSSFRSAETKWFGWGFSLYALGELIYMTHHLDWTVFLFAHTLAEILDVAGIAVIFAATGQKVFVTRQVREAAA